MELALQGGKYEVAHLGLPLSPIGLQWRRCVRADPKTTNRSKTLLLRELNQIDKRGVRLVTHPVH
jgi:hypothetical protein